jgi:hypothetical protein
MSRRPSPGADTDREAVLARAKRYPYAAPRTSFALVGDRTLELSDLGPNALTEGLAGARAHDPETGESRPLADHSPVSLAPSALRERVPLLAYGSNRSADALARKRRLPDFPADDPLVAIRGELHHMDVVYSAHLSPYGAVAATLARSPGTVTEVFVVLLTSSQLAVLDETEPNYGLEELGDLELRLEGGDRLTAVPTYLSVHGCLACEGRPLAVAAIPARDRRYPARTQADALAVAAARLGHAGDLDDLVLTTAADPDLAAARTRELRREALTFEWPQRRPLDADTAPTGRTAPRPIQAAARPSETIAACDCGP